MNRREALLTLGAGAIGTLGARQGFRLSDQLDRIGVQLYTVRRAMAEDFEGTLARVASIGYAEVEFAGYFDREPRAISAILEANGLSAPSAHVGYDLLEDGWDRVLDDAVTVGHQYLICPSLPQNVRGSLDGYRRVADRFNRAGRQAHQAGLRFGYHNHDFEFTPIDGRIPYNMLLDETDPEYVTQQMDLFWIANAGHNPSDYFAAYPGRFSSVHVKDMDGSPDRHMVDVGQGVLDFAAWFAQRNQAGIKHFFVEHDQPFDPIASIRASYEYLRRLTF
ncbi:MAG: TIM barrel protein [Gemmatimonadetes bacterium]|nr:TIM barrel protein [Gemmatimonadota bacterium]